jgi:hypothetical protein
MKAFSSLAKTERFRKTEYNRGTNSLTRSLKSPELLFDRGEYSYLSKMTWKERERNYTHTIFKVFISYLVIFEWFKNTETDGTRSKHAEKSLNVLV